MITWRMARPAGTTTHPDGSVTLELDINTRSAEFAGLFWSTAWAEAGWRLLLPHSLAVALWIFVETLIKAGAEGGTP